MGLLQTMNERNEKKQTRPSLILILALFNPDPLPDPCIVQQLQILQLNPLLQGTHPNQLQEIFGDGKIKGIYGDCKIKGIYGDCKIKGIYGDCKIKGI